MNNVGKTVKHGKAMRNNSKSPMTGNGKRIPPIKIMMTAAVALSQSNNELHTKIKNKQIIPVIYIDYMA